MRKAVIISRGNNKNSGGKATKMSRATVIIHPGGSKTTVINSIKKTPSRNTSKNK